MVLAVLEAHCGVRLGGHDVYLNVAGRHAHPGTGSGSCGCRRACFLTCQRTACRPTRSISARYRYPAPSGRWRKVPPASRRRRNSASTAQWCRKRPAARRPSPGLKIIDVANLANLVADIAAQGKPRMLPKRVDKTGDGAARSRYIRRVKNRPAHRRARPQAQKWA